MKKSRLFLAASLALLAAPIARPADDVAAVIAQARAYLGSEENLNRLKAVRYHGMLEEPNPDPKAGPAAPKTVHTQIDVIFQMPYEMKQVLQDDKVVGTQVLDGFVAWDLTEDKKDPKKRKLILLSSDQMQRMRADAWENLAFYRGVEDQSGHLERIEEMGGSVEDGGPADLDGTPCHKLIFRHQPKLSYTRWFDAATGRLRLTETDDGISVREQGVIIEGGVRFAQKLLSTEKLPNGTVVQSTIVFDRIELNKPEPAVDFYPPTK
jgi:hypothetical protein